MCLNISSGASWSGDRASTGSLIDEWLANLIVLIYGMLLLLRHVRKMKFALRELGEKANHTERMNDQVNKYKAVKFNGRLSGQMEYTIEVCLFCLSS